MKVLVADDNEQILDYLSDILDREGFLVIKAQSGQEALDLYKTEKPDFLCLDIVMPDIKGYDVCREIRKKDNQTPVVFLSSRNEPFDKILGLELGADDYIIKPFDPGELIARIRAIARRCIHSKSPNDVNEFFEMGNLQIFPNQLKAERNGEVIELSLREVKLLDLLYKRANCVVTRDELLDYCWGAHIMPESRTLDLHISKLRKKIEETPGKPKIIQTVHGAGYRYQA